MTPSVRSWGDEKLVLNTAGVVAFLDFFIPKGLDRQQPDLSPLHADLKGMPPALFSVGTRDLLLDDTLFMAPRWLAAGNVAELAIYPGACHGFVSVPFAQRDQAVARINAFIGNTRPRSCRCPATSGPYRRGGATSSRTRSSRGRYRHRSAAALSGLARAAFRPTERSRRHPAAAGRVPACPS